MSQLEQSAAAILLSTHGMIGSKAITGTSVVTPADGYYFCAITAMAATVVASQGDVSGSTNATLSGITSIPAGVTIYGKFSSITLTSGQAIGYYAKG